MEIRQKHSSLLTLLSWLLMLVVPGAVQGNGVTELLALRNCLASLTTPAKSTSTKKPTSSFGSGGAGMGEAAKYDAAKAYLKEVWEAWTASLKEGDPTDIKTFTDYFQDRPAVAKKKLAAAPFTGQYYKEYQSTIKAAPGKVKASITIPLGGGEPAKKAPPATPKTPPTKEPTPSPAGSTPPPPPPPLKTPAAKRQLPQDATQLICLMKVRIMESNPIPNGKTPDEVTAIRAERQKEAAAEFEAMRIMDGMQRDLYRSNLTKWYNKFNDDEVDAILKSCAN